MQLLAWPEENVLREIVRIGAEIAGAAVGRAVVAAEVVAAAADPEAVVDVADTVGPDTRRPATDFDISTDHLIQIRPRPESRPFLLCLFAAIGQVRRPRAGQNQPPETIVRVTLSEL